MTLINRVVLGMWRDYIISLDATSLPLIIVIESLFIAQRVSVMLLILLMLVFFRPLLGCPGLMRSYRTITWLAALKVTVGVLCGATLRNNVCRKPDFNECLEEKENRFSVEYGMKALSWRQRGAASVEHRSCHCHLLAPPTCHVAGTWYAHRPPRHLFCPSHWCQREGLTYSLYSLMLIHDNPPTPWYNLCTAAFVAKLQDIKNNGEKWHTNETPLLSRWAAAQRCFIIVVALSPHAPRPKSSTKSHFGPSSALLEWSLKRARGPALIIY